VKPLILGLGNLERGDDAAGVLVARKLSALGIPAREFQGDGLALLDELAGAGDAILIDAVLTGAPPGSVHVWEGDRAAQAALSGRSCSSHAFGAAEALRLGRILDRLPARLIVVGIEAESFQPGSGTTATVRRGVADATRLVRRLSAEFVGGLSALPARSPSLRGARPWRDEQRKSTKLALPAAEAKKGVETASAEKDA